ncbi:hemerythrin domain-containing protein [Geobacter hydrogenophilus]|uniref:Hemerythrin n=1 Tax=Geobacter hydrogenophilus TaxID=40983 RepID=A0A9W6G0Y8_9BACT|nr:hemerythrin domain-containing protein [Geobacter hydrogenophilus]MBT0893340.1 hemerythrin domain-containing protein [Geobacter hydrogenophilus]GLI38810.1 hemerythrin [Geobacter hydrogenophilus]
MEKKPTDILEEDHHIVQTVVGVMATIAEGLDSGKVPDRGVLRDIVEFMRMFADRCHHGKEESHLFPLLEAKGVPVTGCPLGILIHEHQNGRKLVAELAEAAEAYGRGDTEANGRLRASLQGLVNLYPNHIWKENYLLFPMTNKILSDDEQRELLEKFEQVEESIGKDEHRRFVTMAEVLAEQTHRL